MNQPHSIEGQHRLAMAVAAATRPTVLNGLQALITEAIAEEMGIDALRNSAAGFLRAEGQSCRQENQGQMASRDSS